MNDNNVSLGLVHETEVMLRKFGADREFWKKISLNPKLAEQVVSFVKINPVFNVIVDYDLSLNDMIEASGMEIRRDGSITNEKFPIRGSGKHEISIALFNFNLTWHTSGQASGMMEEVGYRPARLEEILALKKQYSNEELFTNNRYIFASGSVWRNKGFEMSISYVPCLEMMTEEPRLNVFEEGETYKCHLAGVRE